MSDLFRPESIQYRRRRLYGEISLPIDKLTTILTVILGCIVVALIVALLLGSYSRTTTVSGHVTTASPATRVLVPRAGIVTSVFVRDGDYVDSGQPLISVSSDSRLQDGQAAGTKAVAAIEHQISLNRSEQDLSGKIEKVEINRLRAALRGAAEESNALKRQADLQREVAATSVAVVQRLKVAHDNGFVSKFSFEQRQQDSLIQQQRLAQISQQQTQIGAKIAELESQLLRTPIDAAAQQVTLAERAASLQEEWLRAKIASGVLITAPTSGQITNLIATPGRSVDGSSALLSIVPRSARYELELYAPSRAIGFIRVGQGVRVAYDAFPYQKFGTFSGRVTQVSRAPISYREVESSPQTQEDVYRIRVFLGDQTINAKGISYPLRYGMSASGTIILERRGFFEWLLSPISAVRNRA